MSNNPFRSVICMMGMWVWLEKAFSLKVKCRCVLCPSTVLGLEINFQKFILPSMFDDGYCFTCMSTNIPSSDKFTLQWFTSDSGVQLYPKLSGSFIFGCCYNKPLVFWVSGIATVLSCSAFN